ncbi:phage protein [Streptococcus suis]|uniref:Phage protein n=1 Tax=Streptococcus suis TaxID=1307 RepID=A0A0Z8GFK3_STRSU|nr:DUF1642 domain-containing protein [Streptococcus suis]NQH36168.1 DUF1642 domain-containing protein [Streptococcus suis]NQM05521.1 DUF1642 domain-containing protein [Streptococcus suis]CYU97882.1 phage protein [Streptococcus suis]HEM2769960.1 DUF1642 domain-containing protein [Streptococcus suis]HEM4276417.1 DUF1642 domain-containing protein [Streptococcus suis]
MNKQEAIEKLTNIANGTGWVTCTSACNIISQIDQPQTVVVPKFIADSIEYCKNKEGYGLLRAMDYCDEYNDTGEWLERPENQETFACAWLFGYEIEQEKLYTVELFNGQPLVEEKNILYFSSDLAASNAHVGKDKLEAAGFGWVFDCNGVKVVEVKND